MPDDEITPPALPDTPLPARRRRTRPTPALAAAAAVTTVPDSSLIDLAKAVGRLEHTQEQQGADIEVLKTGFQTLHQDVSGLLGQFNGVNLPQLAIDVGKIKTDNEAQTINTDQARAASLAAKRALTGKVWVGAWTLTSGGILALGVGIVSHQSLPVECIALGAILVVGLVLGLIYYLTHRG